ncbi:AfsR/SARP family transcriptional regulator [Streptomyces sp. H27-G5]|uniref:AfsR/SARP family transcriptional regulator n=1 Tax=Streptomyces sp. H27-G5 TaxID=2996698 RepID=UPI002D1E372A|nr:AfsR/SARP family transcriptional regulator [Streptomyces sp. H27-G5]
MTVSSGGVFHTPDAVVFRVLGPLQVTGLDGPMRTPPGLLRSAGELWQGDRLSGVSSETLRSKALQLDEERLTAVETRIELDLDLGRHHQLVGEIQLLVRVHPLRERLRGQLMLALYRSARQAEALESYRVGRDLLVEELGLEPGRRVRQTRARP